MLFVIKLHVDCKNTSSKLSSFFSVCLNLLTSLMTAWSKPSQPRVFWYSGNPSKHLQLED